MNNNYNDFIKEAFIRPIRTVTLVDDEYPTMDVFISGELSKEKEDNKPHLKDLISICREPSNNWMLDVYDGIPQNTDGEKLFSSRLHNSDLLILDYHLGGPGDDEPGWDALKVLQHLASKPHFNLVAIYTKGYEGGDIERIIKDIVCSLQKVPVIKEIHEKLAEIIDGALDDWSLEIDGIQTKLVDSITDLDFLSSVREYGDDHKEWPEDCHYISELKAIYDRKSNDVNIAFRNLLWWVFNEKTLKLRNYFGDAAFPNFGWGMEENINWVHTDQLFVTVVDKKNSPDILPEKILEALGKWNPHPHKLILTKLRHEIDDEQGIAIANKILDKQYVHAYWLEEILTADKDAADFKVWTVLCRHWEELAGQTKKVLTDFTSSMVAQLKESKSVEEILNDFTKPNIRKDRNRILLHANCFNCSKPVEGYHLTTGHVLELKKGNSVNYWVCVTPACDLEPGQNKKSLEGRIPITLLRLYEGASACQKKDEKRLNEGVIFERALEKATSKKVLFLNFQDDNDVCIFSSIVKIHGNANPYLEDFFVENSGKFNQDGYKLTLYRTVLDDEHLIYENTEATVVAQLRYEYALDLLLKTGGCKSRIGLDFIGL